MRLAEDSRVELELFFREFLRDENVRIPRVWFYAGRGARWLTLAGRVGAITLGRRVLVAPSFLSRGEGGAGIPGGLAAHEVAHVLQYERNGVLRFLPRYLFEYCAGLWKAGKLDAASRMSAYRGISFEQEAHAAERAFAGRRGREGAAPVPGAGGACPSARASGAAPG